ncbi:MAG TPA: hypothetical protein VKG82_03285 [Solirubrobacteraceae bacterium]|nr:hypothetical protein [Solirubrobacteraceae bacterium]
MSSGRANRLHLAVAILGALAVSGCASSSAQPGADVFYREHAGEAARAAAATRTVQAAVSRLSRPPTQTQLEQLSLDARRGRRDVVPASEWSVTENGEEEDVSQAELELNEGATAFLMAMAALRAYARAPRQSELAVYEDQLAHGRERWDQGIRQLWYLAHQPNPPTV